MAINIAEGSAGTDTQFHNYWVILGRAPMNVLAVPLKLIFDNTFQRKKVRRFESNVMSFQK